jgi:lipid-A-disaccharide synthase
MTHKEPTTVVMVAGEPSGDMHGAHLIRALRECLGSGLHVRGMGGREMRAAGADILVDADQVAVVGITEVISKMPRLFKAMSQIKQLLSDARPALLILIDFPDFNLHLARYAKKLNIPVLYYISPQLWAWRAKRVKKIKARVDHMAVILPFEEKFYKQHGVPVTFVGHPLMDAANLPAARNPAAPGSGQAPVVALLPGSRDREVQGLLPIMLQAGRMLQSQIGPVRFLISCAPSIDMTLVRNIVDQGQLEQTRITTASVRELLPGCHLAIVASGTVTLEGAICTTPMVITYVVSPLSYRLGKVLVSVAHIGLVNLIADRRIVPELVQQEATPQAICEAARSILSDPKVYADMCRDLTMVRNRLGESGASEKVARIACELMGHDNAL